MKGCEVVVCLFVRKAQAGVCFLCVPDKCAPSTLLLPHSPGSPLHPTTNQTLASTQTALKSKKKTTEKS